MVHRRATSTDQRSEWKYYAVTPPAILTPVHQRSRSAPARSTGQADEHSLLVARERSRGDGVGTDAGTITDEVEGVTVLEGDEDELVHEVILLPTPEEQLAQLTKEFPPAIIAIDTSEKSFNRMAAMRKSLIHVDFFIRTKNRKNKKVKRSNTICDSCSQGGTVRKTTDGTTSTPSGGQLKLSHSSVQTDSCNITTNNNNNNNNKNHHNNSSSTKSNSNTINNNNNNNATNNNGNSAVGSNQQLKERTKRRSERLSSSSMNAGASALAGTVDSSGSSQDIPTTLKNEKRISFYEKLKQMGRRRETSKERKDERDKDSRLQLKDTSRTTAKLHQQQQHEQQEATVVVISSGGGTFGKDQQQQKISAKLPISSNSQAINVAVKLRESSSRPSEQGQSSSGHWSGSSSGASTRASDCDRDVSPPTVQDSTGGGSGGRGGGGNGSGSSSHDRSGSSVAPAVKKSPSDSSLEKDSALSDTTQTTDRGPVRMLSPLRLKALRSPQRVGPLRKISTCSDDGESSTYSVDTDGYYTSMHTDSGIPQQIPEKLVEEPEPLSVVTICGSAGNKMALVAGDGLSAVVDSGAKLVRRASQGSIDTASVNSILSACDAQAILDDDDLHDLKTLTLTRSRLNNERHLPGAAATTAAGISTSTTTTTTATPAVVMSTDHQTAMATIHHLAQSTPTKSRDRPKPMPPPRTSSVLSPLDASAKMPCSVPTANHTGGNSAPSAMSETDNDGFMRKTAIHAYRYPSICAVSGSSEASESSDEMRSPLETSQVSSLSPISNQGRVGTVAQSFHIQQQQQQQLMLQQQQQQQYHHHHHQAGYHSSQEQQQQPQQQTVQDEPRVFQIKNAFQPVVMHPTRLRSFSIDENANEKQLARVDSLNNEIAQAGIDHLEQLDQLELEFSSLPPTLPHMGQAQILRLDTETSQQQAENARKAQALYQRLYRPTSLLARKYAEKEWLTDGPMSLPLELASNGVPLRRRQSPAIVSPTRGILSRNSEILSQSSPTDTETKSLSESPVDNSPLGIPPPPPLSYHPSILDEGSVREPSVAQSPAKSLEDTSGPQQVKYSTLSLGRNSRMVDMMMRSTCSATMPRSFKPAGSEEGVHSPSLATSSSTLPRLLMRCQTEPPANYTTAVQDAPRYNRANHVELCGTGGSTTIGRPPSASSERSMGEGRGTPLNHFSPIASPQLSAPGPVIHPIAVTPASQTHSTVHNPRSRSGIVDLELNLESCYVPPPQPEMPTPPNRPSRPSSLYDDKVYATFLPGPHTPVATYVPTKQYAPQTADSSTGAPTSAGYAVPFNIQPSVQPPSSGGPCSELRGLVSGLHPRGFSPNENSLPLCSSSSNSLAHMSSSSPLSSSLVGGNSTAANRTQYFNPTYQTPYGTAVISYECPMTSAMTTTMTPAYATPTTSRSCSTSNESNSALAGRSANSMYGYSALAAARTPTVDMVVASSVNDGVAVGAAGATRRDELVWSNPPSADCVTTTPSSCTRDTQLCGAPSAFPVVAATVSDTFDYSMRESAVAAVTAARAPRNASPIAASARAAPAGPANGTAAVAATVDVTAPESAAGGGSAPYSRPPSEALSAGYSHPRDRRSWSVQSENPPPLLQSRDARRASLASDRLGPCKPTSLTDFKRLLIQTRSQTNPAGERRRSATELLKPAKQLAGGSSATGSAGNGGRSEGSSNNNSNNNNGGNAAVTSSSACATSSGGCATSAGSVVKRGAGIKFSSGIEPIEEEGESAQNSPAKLAIV